MIEPKDAVAGVVNVNVTTREKLNARIIPPDEAAALQARIDTVADVNLEWCIFAHPTDYPDRFVARPFIISTDRSLRHKSTMLGAFLLADTLAELRAQLPPGLLRRVPDQVSDPTVVEVWRRHLARDDDQAAIQDGQYRSRSMSEQR